MRRYLYNSGSVPSDVAGDLPASDKVLTMNASGEFTDSIPAQSLAVYTDEFDETAPASVRGVSKSVSGSNVTVSWSASSESDVAYYRIYRNNVKIASTVATSYVDSSGSSTASYSISAVDIYGNEGSRGGISNLSNPSFDAEAYNTQTPSGWSEGGTSDASYTETGGSGHTGARHGTHWFGSAYNVSTYQTRSVDNGLYTLRVKAKHGGNASNVVNLYASGFGGSGITKAVPAGTTTGAYSTVEIKDINVTSGSITFGINSVSNGGGGTGAWVYFDDFELFKQ
jgi:hypothetical protein